MPTMAPTPDAVRRMMEHGWTVAYGLEVISFHAGHRTIRVFDVGHVEVEDANDSLYAPAADDRHWLTAAAILGIAPDRLEFNPFLRRWTSPLGTLDRVRTA
jgi:hypothetical protein